MRRLLRLAPALIVAAGLAQPAGRAAAHRSVADAGSAADWAPAPGAGSWSVPAVLSECAAGAAPRIVFPSDSPSHATGPGAIVWGASARCPGGRVAQLATLGATDVPSAAEPARTPPGSAVAVPGAVSAGPHGQIVIAVARSGGQAREQLLQGSARGPLSSLDSIQGRADASALATAYLGDVGLLSETPGPGAGIGLRLYVERYFSHAFALRAQVTPAAAGSLEAMTVALDYRSDALAVWARDGAIYARDLPASGAPDPAQRLGAAGLHLKIAALLSDDDRAVVAWSEQRSGTTSVYLDLSSTGVRFTTPRLLERFSEPDGIASPAGSPSLVRLSSESVMLAWAGSREGHWVVRTAAIDLHGLRAVSTISTPGQDALLEDLAAGPRGDALLLWTEPQHDEQGRPELGRRAIFAARGIDAYPGRTIFDGPEEVAPPSLGGQATVALDPDSDRALAAWSTPEGTIDYSIRALSSP